MQSFAKGLSRKRIRRQSGSVATLGALWLMVAVICLATIDIGNVFWQKRELQKIADLAALAGAQAETIGACKSNAEQISKLNGLTEFPVVACGNWTPVGGVADSKSFFVAGAVPFNASRVTVARSVPFFFVISNGSSRVVEATATAARSRPLAQLRIRSTLVEIDSEKSKILNPIIGDLLGGKINVSVAGWNGLAKAHVSLLDFFREMGMKKGLIDINASVIDYEKILDLPISALDVVEVMISLLERETLINDDPSSVKLALGDLKVIDLEKINLTIRKLVDLKSGLSEAALQAQINALNLIQIMAQIAGQKTGISAQAKALDIPGIGSVKLSLKVIEPPQASIVAPLPNSPATSFQNAAIAVKTAQIQALISVDLKILDGLSWLTDIVGGLVGFFTSVSPRLVEAPARFDLQLDGVGAQAWIESGQCFPAKSMRVHAETSVAKVRFGKFGDTADEALKNAYSSNPSNFLKPFKIIDIGRQILVFREPGYYGGVGLKIDTAPPNSGSLNNQKIFNLLAPDGIISLDSNKEAFQSFSMTGIVGSLKDLFSKGNIEILQPPTGSDPLAGLLKIVGDIVDGLFDVLAKLIGSILAPLLDPVVDSLLALLGIDVAKAEFEARMNCGYVELVY